MRSLRIAAQPTLHAACLLRRRFLGEQGCPLSRLMPLVLDHGQISVRLAGLWVVKREVRDTYMSPTV